MKPFFTNKKDFFLLALLFTTAIFFFNTTIKSQNNWGFYINAANTNLINKDAAYAKTAFNSIGDFKKRQPFYGSLIKQTATWHKSFGAWYKLPLKKEKIKFYVVTGVSTYGHKEELNGGKSEDYPYGFYQNLPPGDTAIKIVNKFRNYFFSIVMYCFVASADIPDFSILTFTLLSISIINVLSLTSKTFP